MPKHNPEYDYFLVVENSPPNEDTVSIFAEGEGLDVVEAIARLGILAASAPADTGIDSYVAMRTIRDLAEHRQSDSQSEFIILYNGKDLADLRGPATRLTSSRVAESIAEQVRLGRRSPQSVLKQMDLHLKDEKLIMQLDSRWYNALGQRIVPPNWRQKVRSHSASTEHLALESVKRNDKAYFISPEAKQAVYDVTPKRAMVRLNRVVSFNSLNHYGVEPRHAYSQGELMEHKTFGYLKNRQFTPVVTDLAWNHGVVLRQKAKK